VLKFLDSLLILASTQLAYNILRFIGQNGRLGPEAPLRHRAPRQRLRTLLQELMYLAARLIDTGRRIKLAFGFDCPVVPIFQRLYVQLAGTGFRSRPWPHQAHLVAAVSLSLWRAMLCATTVSQPD